MSAQRNRTGVRRRATQSGDSTPSPKRSKPAKFQSIIDAMKSYKDDSGELISSPFIRVPPKRTHPDYYKVITGNLAPYLCRNTKSVLEPIDLSTIQRKIRNDEYKAFEEFQYDVQLLVDNAKRYYDCNDKG